MTKLRRAVEHYLFRHDLSYITRLRKALEHNLNTSNVKEYVFLCCVEGLLDHAKSVSYEYGVTDFYRFLVEGDVEKSTEMMYVHYLYSLGRFRDAYDFLLSLPKTDRVNEELDVLRKFLTARKKTVLYIDFDNGVYWEEEKRTSDEFLSSIGVFLNPFIIAVPKSKKLRNAVLSRIAANLPEHIDRKIIIDFIKYF